MSSGRSSCSSWRIRCCRCGRTSPPSAARSPPSTRSRGNPRRFRSRLDPGADQRQRPAEDQHLAVFRLVAHLAPARVIAVLLAAALVAPGRLDVPVRVGTDPHLGPGRRDDQRADAFQASRYRAPARRPAAGNRTRSVRFVTGDARCGIADVAQLRPFGGDDRIERRSRARRRLLARAPFRLRSPVCALSQSAIRCLRCIGSTGAAPAPCSGKYSSGIEELMRMPRDVTHHNRCRAAADACWLIQ